MALPRAGRSEAAAAIWSWRSPRSESESAPSFKRERIRGSLQAAVGATLGGVLLYFGLRPLAVMLFGAATLILFAALVSPAGLYAALERITGAIARKIGWALMWLFMVPLFYLFFMPFGLLFRRGRRDRLQRYFDRDADTYWDWEPQEGHRAASSSRERQY
jgi:hypothetical protein